MDDEGYIVRIRGLPWSAGPEEIQAFLEGICLELFIMQY